MLIRLLTRAGHSCVPATSGREAVAVMHEDLAAFVADPVNHVPIDCILMDYEVCRFEAIVCFQKFDFAHVLFLFSQMPLLNEPCATKEI